MGVEKDPVRGTKVAVANYRTGGWQEDVRYSSDLWSWARTSDGGADMKMVTIVWPFSRSCSLRAKFGRQLGRIERWRAVRPAPRFRMEAPSAGPADHLARIPQKRSTAARQGITSARRQTAPAGPAATHGNAVDTPAAKAATQNLGNTDAGVLKK